MNIVQRQGHNVPSLPTVVIVVDKAFSALMDRKKAIV
jgi:hypothetical protein